jgi:hypothetical protein
METAMIIVILFLASMFAFAARHPIIGTVCLLATFVAIL